MARRRYTWDERRIATWVRTGRGIGTGRDYVPWLKVSDVPSLGRVHRVFWATTERDHHLLSDNEYYAFLGHCYDDDVIDIREQFPLDRAETLEIARELGIRHPEDRTSKTPLVATTDFLVTRLADGGARNFAYAVKENCDLTKLRTIEKLEIERVYWTRRAVPWTIQVGSNIKTNVALNLAWIFDCRGARKAFEALGNEPTKEHLKATFDRHPAAPLRVACKLVDTELKTKPGKTLQIARRLLSTKEMLVDLSVKGLVDLPCSEFSFPRGLA